jgi:hypothetical protein
VSESRPTPAEQHLGDRLSALVDGELGHEARERVLAHLATCGRCRVEAEAQRRLKHVFAEVSGPTPSESFLARLQGLPAGGFDDLRGPGGDPAEEPGSAMFGSRRGDPFGLTVSTAQGFPIHDVGRAQAERAAASRSRRFAYAAAGAVSLAAVALGGVTTVVPVADADRGGLRSNVTPARQQGAGTVTTTTDARRRTAAPLLAQSASAQRQLATAAAPLLSGGAQSVPGDGGLAPTPLIAPGAPVVPALPGLLAAPEPTGTVAPPPVGR